MGARLGLKYILCTYMDPFKNGHGTAEANPSLFCFSRSLHNCQHFGGLGFKACLGGGKQPPTCENM